MLGTNGYAPPEQYGSRQTDARSDIYALGMTMHHLLTGVDPCPKDYMYYPVRQWKPELYEGIEIIIDKCVQPAPEKRYQSCTELLYDLEHSELITRDYKRRQKRKLRTFLIMLIMSALALLSGFVCRAVAADLNSGEYETLIAAVDSPESYIRAIGIFPYDTRGYMKLLEVYESQGHFGKQENDQFLAPYNANKDGFDKTGADYAELNYKIGMMYFNYYFDAGKETGSASYRECIVALLEKHPEGICIRSSYVSKDGGHAVLVTDYEVVDNKIQLYVQDPANNGRVKLENSYYGRNCLKKNGEINGIDWIKYLE